MAFPFNTGVLRHLSRNVYRTTFNTTLIMMFGSNPFLNMR